MSDPTVPELPVTVPDAPSPNVLPEVPEPGEPETEPDRQNGSASA